MREVIRVAIKEASKKSVKIDVAARKFANTRLKQRFSQLTKNTVPNEKSVVFIVYMGKGYADSPLAMYLEMINDPYYDDWEFTWVFKRPNSNEFIGKGDLVKKLSASGEIKPTVQKKLAQYLRAKTTVYNTPEYYEVLAKTKYWVCNSRIQEGVFPGDKHVFIQTWHGTPLKRLGADIEVESNAKYSKKSIDVGYRQEGNKWDYLISPSSFYTEKLKTSFLIDESNDIQIIEEGYPRNDFLINHTQNDINSVRKYLGIPKDKKVLLYAPTWRDNQHDSKQGYTYELGADFDKLQKELGGEWVILFRAHYFVANKFDFSRYKGFVYDASKHVDINELYIAADCLMTDYSSVFFDYALLDRPIVFFMYDKQHYADDIRGFYLDLGELPGDIVENNEDVIKSIKNVATYKKRYSKKLKEFKKKFNYLDDGKAAKRVVNAIFKKDS